MLPLDLGVSSRYGGVGSKVGLGDPGGFSRSLIIMDGLSSLSHSLNPTCPISAALDNPAFSPKAGRTHSWFHQLLLAPPEPRCLPQAPPII